MNYSKLYYRPEIDGLRAVAVVSVIFYHAQMPLFGRDWFEGGFVGVDVFFVISGYLITRIILHELQSKGSFSFLAFYERRARRILPMLLTTIAVSIPFAWQKLLPSDFTSYAESVLASLFFFSNFFFYWSTTEYGADDALLNPFLHTWSLSVEEQFYIVLPILATLVYKFSRDKFSVVITTMAFFSLLISEVMASRDSILNFYLPVTRFWELAAGSLLAHRELNYKTVDSGLAGRVLSILGLMLLGYSILTFDAETRHPSFYTLLPIAGVALIISFASKDELVGRALGSKPFVLLGLISYSAYLWHFVIFSFSRRGMLEPTNADKMEWLTLTVALSAVSYAFIERPLRKKVSSRNFIIIILLSVSILAGFSTYVVTSAGVPSAGRLGFNIGLIDTVHRPAEFFRKDGSNSCHNATVSVGGLDWCELGDGTAQNVNLVILGDSHSISSTVTMNKLLQENSQKGLYFGTPGCPPLLNLYAVRGHPHPSPQASLCQNHLQATLKMAEQKSIKSVLLIARWDYYVDGSDSGNWQKITDQNFAPLNIQQARAEYSAAVVRTRKAFLAEGVDLYVLLQVPHQNVNVRRVFEDFLNNETVEQRLRFLEAGEEKFLKRRVHNQRQFIASSAWKSPIEKANFGGRFVILDPAEVFCGKNKCPIYDKKTSFYFDEDHASTNGFARLEGLISEAIF